MSEQDFERTPPHDKAAEMATLGATPDVTTPVGGFAFEVVITVAGAGGKPLCSGSFAEVSGLEATMEPKRAR